MRVSGSKAGESKGTQGNQTWECPVRVWHYIRKQNKVYKHEGTQQLYNCEECNVTFKSKYW